jgi:nitrogenase molybdenum-iron protein alpha/beta subunit/MoaA/NifB/PqqE/SkfB family radical SAM enzyme
MNKNFADLNVNPCKMCVPLGAATAFYGIRKCMSILHGSQGCSTYIRRHMATHYNEPVDIASSSLTEQGTVFGGEKNLLQGLENLIRLYEPEVIGVATTCLAETIGEDVPAMIKKFYEQHPEYRQVKIINASTAGYAGTQNEGFFRALRAIVSQVEMRTEKNGKLNVITGYLSPADQRYLKELLAEMGPEFILLPDFSDNLDGGHETMYQRLPQKGTSLEEIAQMGGARCTLELSRFVRPEDSPGAYLQQQYGVPCTRLDIPCGLRGMDALLSALTQLGGRQTEKIWQARSRYLDAMVDSHKYSALGRALIFGEPDFVQGTVKLCAENGLIPVAALTGAVCPEFRQALSEEMAAAAEIQFIDKFVIEDDADFARAEALAVALGVNILIGNSDGRRIAEKMHLPLIRASFPIHDQVGGQRIRTIGYSGSLAFLDRMANALLLQRASGFREDMYKKYYLAGATKPTQIGLATDKAAMLAKKTAEHPCFTCGQGKYARIHLPIAPACNVQCNYCLRKYDCPNESRPGVTTEILSPEEALMKYQRVKADMPNLRVVGIAGPGDSLANFAATKATLTLLHEFDPDVTFCLSTNGLMLPAYAEELIRLQVTHVTITINAVDPKIGAQIYKYVDYMGTRYHGESAAGILLANQLTGLQYLAQHDVVCKVNIVALKGINETHIEDVVRKVKELGAKITNIMQMIPVAGSAFEHIPMVSLKEIAAMRARCSVYLEQMMHCRQCRADAAGTLDHDVSILYRRAERLPADEAAPLQRVAVATKSGTLVDQHFGQANEFYIYESDGIQARFIERRNVVRYCQGKEICETKTDRIEALLHTIKDCSSVLAMRIGDSPQRKLEAMGIRVIATYDRIEDAVKKAAQGA